MTLLEASLHGVQQLGRSPAQRGHIQGRCLRHAASAGRGLLFLLLLLLLTAVLFLLPVLLLFLLPAARAALAGRACRAAAPVAGSSCGWPIWRCGCRIGTRWPGRP